MTRRTHWRWHGRCLRGVWGLTLMTSDNQALPIEHIERSRPPWRDTSKAKTECGRAVSEFTAVITRDEARAKISAQGKQRAAMTTCMTCWETASRHGDWDADPCGVIEREAHSNRWRYGEPSDLERELRIFAVLYEAHREEFDEIAAALAAAVPLNELRAKKARAQRLGGQRR